jgi:hypothetical protein
MIRTIAVLKDFSILRYLNIIFVEWLGKSHLIWTIKKFSARMKREVYLGEINGIFNQWMFEDVCDYLKSDVNECYNLNNYERINGKKIFRVLQSKINGLVQGLLTKNPHKVGPYFFIQFWILDFDKITKVYGKV